MWPTDIVAPALPGYEYLLLHIAHGLAFYPVDVFVAEELLEVLPAPVTADRQWEVWEDPGYVRVFTADGYVEVVRRILGAYRTRQVVRALASQAEEAGEVEVTF